MIHRTRFIRRCKAEGLKGNTIGHANMFWRVPVQYIIWWNDATEEVCFVPNTSAALSDPYNHHIAVFDDLDYAITAYNLLNP